MLDLLIIGSGPAGLSAGVYAKRANLNFILAEKEFLGAGQIMNSIRVDNYLGFYGISGYDLGDKFRLHAEELRVPFLIGEAREILPVPGGWRVTFDKGDVQEARTLIYCGGTRTRHLDIMGQDTFGRKGIHSCVVCDGPYYKNKSVAVVGGGDTAIDTAKYLSDLANQVYLIHWMNEFQGNENTLDKLKADSRVEVLPNTSVLMALGQESLESLVLSNGRIIKVDGLFEAIGALPETEMLKEIAALDERGYIKAGEDCITSAPGLFAAGDVRTKRLRQVSTAVADGANAVYSVMEYLRRFE